MSESLSSGDLRRFVAERAFFCCEYCLSQLKFSPDPFSVEHITPRVKEGANTESNLCLSCQGCNNHKYVSTSAADPATGAIVPLYHPRQDVWSDHFAWTEDFSRLMGISATGRATIMKLNLNREGVVNLRQILRQVGKHPPER